MKPFPEWNLIIEELPPMDGFYEVTNIISLGSSAICEYDGFGFKYESHYINPTFWREFIPLTKKYGKVKND